MKQPQWQNDEEEKENRLLYIIIIVILRHMKLKRQEHKNANNDIERHGFSLPFLMF